MLSCRGRRAFWTALILLAGTALRAHIPLHGVGTECRLIFKEDRVLLTFDLSYDGFWSQSEMIRADTDRSSSVEDAEADAYLRKKWEEKVRPGIRVRIDGREATIRKSAERHEGLVGEIYAVRFSLYYELEIEIPGGRGAPGVSHGFEMEDVVVQNETPARPRFLIPYQGHGEGGGTVFRPRFLEPELQILELDGYTLESARIRLSFSFEGSGAGQAVAAAVLPRVEGPEERGAEGEAGAGTGTGTGAEARRTQGTAQDLEQALLRYDELRWYEVLGLILIAVLYGAGHALTPGHGKSMVAAYLIGTRGRVRDAVILGLATTICHTGSVFLFGAGIFLIVNASTRLSETQVSNMVIVACQLLSGVILLILGITLFLKRWRGVEHGHGHGHHHHHRDHHHGHHHHHHGPHDHHAHGNEPGEPHGHHHGHAHGQEHGHDESHDHDHRGPGPHHHDHPHGHSHHHHHMETEGRSPTGEQGLFQGGTPRLRELLVLGFSGGLVPCPAGLAIIFIGLHYPHRLLFALALLIFFSIGLGSVLVAIGVFLVTGKLLAAGKLRDGAFFQDFPFLRDRLPARFLAGLDRGGLKLFRILPALSSLFIACLGAFFCVSAFREGKTEIAAMLRHAADWLR